MAIATGETLFLNFAWAGPNIQDELEIRVVDLLFQDIKTKISIDLPKNINPVTPQKFSFTCCKHPETETSQNINTPAKQTHLSCLSVTAEQIHNLTIKANFFERSSPIDLRIVGSLGTMTQQQTARRSQEIVSLEIPEKLELGQTYTLLISLCLSARLVKEEQGPSSNLDFLTPAELLSLLEEAHKKKKDLEGELQKAAEELNGTELNRIFELQSVNDQLLIDSSAALERRGIEYTTPESANCTLTTEESKIQKHLEEDCNIQ